MVVPSQSVQETSVGESELFQALPPLRAVTTLGVGTAIRLLIRNECRWTTRQSMARFLWLWVVVTSLPCITLALTSVFTDKEIAHCIRFRLPQLVRNTDSGAVHVLAVGTDIDARDARLRGCPHGGVHARQQTKVFCLDSSFRRFRIRPHARPAGVEALS